MNLALTKNDKKAKTIIYIVSFVVFAAVVLLGRVQLIGKSGF